MKDFTRQPRVVQFTLDGDTFRGKPHLPAQVMIDFTLKVGLVEEESATPQQGIDTMMECLQMVLMPESYALFRSRMNDPSGTRDLAAEAESVLFRLRSQLTELGDGKVAASQVLAFLDTSAPAAEASTFVPIELDQVTEILDYVMGEYGLRPTKPSEGSSPGQSSPDSGTNSTAPTSDVESTSATSPSTDSSMSSTTS
jgi:hypothetical protein